MKDPNKNQDRPDFAVKFKLIQLIMNNQKDSSSLEQQHQPSIRQESQHKYPKELKRKEMAADQMVGQLANKHNIFQQFIAGSSQYSNQVANIDLNNFKEAADQVSPQVISPNPTFQNVPQFPQKSSPVMKQQSSNLQIPNISNSKKGQFEMNTHLSTFGKQAMAGPPIKSVVLQIKNQNMLSSHDRDLKLTQQISSQEQNQNNDSPSLPHMQPHSLSFEENKDIKYQRNVEEEIPKITHSEAHTLSNQLNDSMNQRYNNLNHGLLQIQPQTTIRGQKRHFQPKNEFELLMKNVQSQPKDHSVLNKTTAQQQSKSLRRRGAAFQGVTNSNIFEQDSTTAENATPKQRMATNPRQAYQQSIFQKNRQKVLQNQTLEVIQQDSQGYQYKGLFAGLPSQNSGNLSQYGQTVMNRSSPKQKTIGGQAINQIPQQFRKFNDQQSDFSLATRNRIGQINQKTQQVPEMSADPVVAKEALFSPQPKPSSQMSQYTDNQKQNTAQLIIRKAKAEHLEKLRDNQRNHSQQPHLQYSLTKTEEKHQKTRITNFRKYKKKIGDPVANDSETNVLGQPNMYKRSIYSNRVSQNTNIQQTSITLPSMQETDKTGVPGTSNAATGSFQQASTNQEHQPQKTTSSSFIRKNRKHSIFSVSNFSGNITENVIQDVNYNIKGSNETQRIAWEIKFNSHGDHSDEQNSQDFIYSELQKHRQSQNKSPLIKQKNSFKFTQRASQNATSQGGGGGTLNNSGTQNENLAKLIQKQRQMPVPLVTSVSPSKKANPKNRNLVQRLGEVPHKTHPRRQGVIKLQNTAGNYQTETAQHDKKVVQMLQEPTKPGRKVDTSTNTFKKSFRTIQQQFKQTEGDLPVELIVTGYKKEDMEHSLRKEQPAPQLMNFVREKPPNRFENEEKKVFDYVNMDTDFFQPTQEGEFDRYMAEHEELSRINASEVNPSANPASELRSDSEFSRKTPQSDEKEYFKIQPKLENKIIDGKAQKSIVRLKISDSKSSEKSGQPLAQSIQLLPNVRQQIRWSGDVSAKTQFIFNKVVMQNKNIKEKLMILQKVGIINESNSLFKQIVQDIQQATSNSMTRSDIVNCIKASSFGMQSAIEPHTLDLRQSHQLRDAFNQLVHNSGGQSRGYSLYQSQFQIDNRPRVFKKSQSLKQSQMRILNDYQGRNQMQQLYQSQVSAEEIHSHNLPLIKSLNFLESERTANIAGVNKSVEEMKQIINVPALKARMSYFNQGQMSSSGRANTVRVTNQLKLKKSFQSLNQNRINLNQPRIEARNIMVLGNQHQDSIGLRQIQSQRVLQQQNLTNPKKSETTKKLLITKKTTQRVVSFPTEEMKGQQSDKNLEVKIEVKGSKQISSMRQQPANQKFSSYHHVKQEPSSSSQPSQSQVSLPSLQVCHSGPKQSSSGGGIGNKNAIGSSQKHSSGESNYNNKYKKTKQLEFVQGGLFGQAQNSQEPVEFGQIIKWRQGEIIGLGSSSIVYSAIRVDTNTFLAVKKFKVVSDITGVDQGKLKIIKNEIQKYKQLNHANLVTFYGCELLDQFFCVYLEKMETSLANILSEYGYFDEMTIKHYTKQILLGLEYLHDQKIKHLDLKCSNILTNNDGKIKLCDFGSARDFKIGSNSGSSSFTSLKSQLVGSVQWMAPEVIAEEGSGSKSDIWSLGCTIVEMFVGGNPWGDKIDEQNLFLAQQTIMKSEFLPSIPTTTKVSMDCEDFIQKCLTRSYKHRPSASELLQHKWINK